MKMRCWTCAVLGLILMCAYARSADAEKNLPSMNKGVVVSVTEQEVVAKSDDKDIGEVAYPIERLSKQVKLEHDALKELAAETRTRGKYFAPGLKLSDLKPGMRVSVRLDDAGESGKLFQITVLKLAEKKQK